MKRTLADPRFQDRQAEARRKLQARQAELAELYSPILDRLAACGFPADSVEQLVRMYCPLPPPVVDVLLGSLPSLSAAGMQEGAIRALGAAAEPFDGRALVECFRQTDSEGVKFAIANTIAMARPHSIDQWLDSMRDTAWGETLQKLRKEEPGLTTPNAIE